MSDIIAPQQQAKQDGPACLTKGLSFVSLQMEGSPMDEKTRAGMLTGYGFVQHPDDPTAGILRLNTKDKPLFVVVTKKDLLMLSEALAEHADELEEHR